MEHVGREDAAEDEPAPRPDGGDGHQPGREKHDVGRRDDEGRGVESDVGRDVSQQERLTGNGRRVVPHRENRGGGHESRQDEQDRPQRRSDGGAVRLEAVG
ncbi:hypothetical protein, partial [Haloarcula sp. CBA1122]|uniref:hypothetical protein n=1 Tax=Haloarcula sp. CBA1122 TaxID=2668069 RepID=UPI0020910175